MTHGYSVYTNYGCRCEICTAENRRHQAIYRNLRKEKRIGCQHDAVAYDAKLGCRVCSRCEKRFREKVAPYQHQFSRPLWEAKEIVAETKLATA